MPQVYHTSDVQQTSEMISRIVKVVDTVENKKQSQTQKPNFHHHIESHTHAGSHELQKTSDLYYGKTVFTNLLSTYTCLLRLLWFKQGLKPSHDLNLLHKLHKTSTVVTVAFTYLNHVSTSLSGAPQLLKRLLWSFQHLNMLAEAQEHLNNGYNSIYKPSWYTMR